MVLTDGDTVQPSSETLYRIDFASSGKTTIELSIGSDSYYSLFTEHAPEEFKAELRSGSGAEMTPSTTERDSSHDQGSDDHDHGH